MSRIEALTPAQDARLSEFREKWIGIGLSTEPANRPEAERGIRLVYQYAGLRPPTRTVWCGSPLGLCMTRDALMGTRGITGSATTSVRADVKASLRASVSLWDCARNRVEASVGASVWDRVGDGLSTSRPRTGAPWIDTRHRVRDSTILAVGNRADNGIVTHVWNRMRNSIGASAWNDVGHAVWESVQNRIVGGAFEAVWASVREVVGPSRHDTVGIATNDRGIGYGQHDAHWLAFYEFFCRVCGLEDETQQVAGHWLQAKNAGWWSPHENVCWLSERHHTLRCDEAGRLHCTDGPAVAYPDGWSIYAVHGVRIPRQVIERRDRITPRTIDNQRNAELRRIMLELYGIERYVHDTNAKAIHSDSYGDLYRISEDGSRPVYLVCVRNTTPESDGKYKVYWLKCDPRARTAREAVASTFGMRGSDYAPTIET